jgi:hypothetical protein
MSDQATTTSTLTARQVQAFELLTEALQIAACKPNPASDRAVLVEIRDHAIREMTDRLLNPIERENGSVEMHFNPVVTDAEYLAYEALFTALGNAEKYAPRGVARKAYAEAQKHMRSHLKIRLNSTLAKVIYPGVATHSA